MLKFSINSRLPSLNDYVSRNRANRYSGAKYKGFFDDICAAEIRRQHVRKIKTPCIIFLTWREPNRRRDLDNVYSGKKYILDAMQKTGIIKNDDQSAVVGFVENYRIEKNNPGVDVKILESGDKERDTMKMFESWQRNMLTHMSERKGR